MPKPSVADLLPIPPGTARPNAYEVFGLQEGEQDEETIKAAIKTTAKRLRDRKGTVESEVWKVAANLARQAQAILSDAEKKAALDARFGIVVMEDTATNSAGTLARPTSADPLQGLLPSGDPFATDTVTDQASAAGEGGWQIPPPQREARASQPSPQPASPQPASPQPASQQAAPLFVTDPAPRKRARRRPGAGTWLLAALSLCLVALAGALGYFMFAGPGAVEIASGNGTISIRTRPSGGESRRAASDKPRDPSPGARKVTPAPDPVMSPVNEAADPDDPPQSLAVDLAEETGLAAAGPIAPPDATTTESMGVDSGLMASQQRRSPPDPANGSAAANKPEAVMEVTTAGPKSADATKAIEELRGSTDTAAADRAIQTAAQAIRNAQWERMKPLARQATAAAVTQQQEQRSRSLYEVADLATYYRGGIERAVDQLGAGEVIAVGPVKLIVVEATREAVAVRRSARTHSYTLDELPPALAHALALFSMSADDPNARAAKWVYQAVAPGFNEEYRSQSVTELPSVGEGLQGADPDRLVAAIEWLFPRDN